MSQPSKNKDRPLLAFGMKRVPGGWQVIKMQIKDGRVVKEEASEPQNRPLALELFQHETGVLWSDE